MNKNILNVSYARRVCHKKKVKISQEAIDEINRILHDSFDKIIKDVKEEKIIVIQKRHVRCMEVPEC